MGHGLWGPALEEFVHLLQHFFDAESDLIALLVHGGDLSLGGVGRASELVELLTQRGGLGFGGGAGLALAAHDFYRAEDLLLKGLELVGADAGGFVGLVQGGGLPRRV